jgi:protoporphyrinogen IX oxidase
MYLWFKAAHVVFVVSWFATLFYLPRLYVNLAQVSDTKSAEYQRLLGMAERLKRFSIPLHIGTWVLGFSIIFSNGMDGVGAWFSQGWLHAKLALVLFLSAYDGKCSSLLRVFREGKNTRSHVWYRWFNEVPVVVLVVVVILVIVKPF